MVSFSSQCLTIIRALLEKGTSKKDFVSLINRVISHQNNQSKTKKELVSIEEIECYTGNLNHKYTHFKIAKKKGGHRTISAPYKFLKNIQNNIAIVLSSIYTPKSATHGFVSGKSIVSNAQCHIGRKYVYNIDLKDFFPSIHQSKINFALLTEPFNMSKEMAYLISKFSCYNNVLPQGSPLSPILTNIVCQKLDEQLVKLAKHYKCFYSRYADDITFSSDKNIFKKRFLSQINDIVTREGFEINKKKISLQKYTQRQEVTGIIVNKKTNLKRDYIKQIRALLHNWEQKGITYCQATLIEKYPKEKGFNRNKETPSFKMFLHGKIMFLGMVRGHQDEVFKKYYAKYKELSKNIE